MSWKDKVNASDQVQAGISKEVVAPSHSCPACGKETREHENGRICSVCKYVVVHNAIEAPAAALPEVPTFSRTTASTWSGNKEWLCPKCGKPGREKSPGVRICANRLCKFEFEEASVKPIEVILDLPPQHPCPKCSKESKEHVNGTRICSLCRFEFRETLT